MQAETPITCYYNVVCLLKCRIYRNKSYLWFNSLFQLIDFKLFKHSTLFSLFDGYKSNSLIKKLEHILGGLARKKIMNWSFIDH